MENNTDFRIIVIDDNPAIHHDFIKILTKTGTESSLDTLRSKMFGKKGEDTDLPNFQIDTASQGQEGVEQIKKAYNEKRPYSLAFVDIRMPPGWDGIETIKHIWSVDNDIQVVICTAYSDYSWEETVAHLGKKDNLLILKKPFDNISVRQLACALTKKWQLLQDSRKFTSSLQQEVSDRTVSLQKSLSLIKATLESSDEGIIVVSNDDTIVDYNKNFCEIWGVGKKFIETSTGDDLKTYMQKQLKNPKPFIKWYESLLNTNESSHFAIIEFNNGKVLDCYSQPQKINDKIVGRVLNFRDITERVELEKELQFLAKHDALTELPNRVLLLEKAYEAIKEARENNELFAIIFIDLDRFKLINDSLSHAAGDELLRSTSSRLKSIMRDEDTLARLGGDEFIIILNNMKSTEDIIAKINNFLKLFQQPFTIANRQVRITASFGISVFPHDGESVDTLMRNADAAMYNIKESGSNNFRFYSPEMNQLSLEKLDEEIQLRDAITKNQLFHEYQPQYDLNNEKLAAVEALVRWNHPTKGTLLPIDFIPLAEETGLITAIGEWSLRNACIQNKKWQDEGLPPIRVAVNITCQQLKQDNIVSIVKSILEETGLKPEYLELELTENVIISSAEVLHKVTELKKLGVNIAIDDFGTGYSSLSYLKKLPLDRLKIDGSFIQHIKSEKDDEVIIKAIIAVAKNLKLEVLAEGVETENQLNFLKKQNCDEIQGYYFSKPLPPNEIEALLNKNK